MKLTCNIGLLGDHKWSWGVTFDKWGMWASLGFFYFDLFLERDEEPDLPHSGEETAYNSWARLFDPSDPTCPTKGHFNCQGRYIMPGAQAIVQERDAAARIRQAEREAGVCLCRAGHTHFGGHSDPECPLHEPGVVHMRGGLHD